MSTPSQDSIYDLQSVKMPYLAGPALRFFVALLEGPLGGLLTPSLLKSAGVTWLREQPVDEPPTTAPLHLTGTLNTEAAAVPEAERPQAAAAPGPGFHFATVYDYARAYREGTLTPEAVAAKVLDAIEASNRADPPLRAIIAANREDVLRQAHEATERIRSGHPLSPFDGVPVAVKDEVDMVPYPTTVGTAFLGRDRKSVV